MFNIFYHFFKTYLDFLFFLYDLWTFFLMIVILKALSLLRPEMRIFNIFEKMQENLDPIVWRVEERKLNLIYETNKTYI